MSWKPRPCSTGQIAKCKLNNNNNNKKLRPSNSCVGNGVYREKLFRLLILTTHFEVIEIGEVASISNNDRLPIKGNKANIIHQFKLHRYQNYNAKMYRMYITCKNI